MLSVTKGIDQVIKNSKNEVGKIPVEMSHAGKPFKSWTWIVGYYDALAGNPFRREYDTWSRGDQGGYEIGRLVAVNIKSAGIKPPRLIKNRTKAFIAAYQIARENVGHAHIVANHHEANQAFEETVQVY